MKALVKHWQTDYDWRKVEAKLNALPQFMTTIDGVDVHFIHVKSKHENALPLIVTHGWPDHLDLLDDEGAAVHLRPKFLRLDFGEGRLIAGIDAFRMAEAALADACASGRIRRDVENNIVRPIGIAGDAIDAKKMIEVEDLRTRQPML